MNRGCWLLIDGKKVAAVRGPDGVAVPVDKAAAAPTPKPKKGKGD